jgi:hypothetical protein
MSNVCFPQKRSFRTAKYGVFHYIGVSVFESELMPTNQRDLPESARVRTEKLRIRAAAPESTPRFIPKKCEVDTVDGVCQFYNIAQLLFKQQILF